MALRTAIVSVIDQIYFLHFITSTVLLGKQGLLQQLIENSYNDIAKTTIISSTGQVGTFVSL